MFGQLSIAVVVAQLVGLRLAQVNQQYQQALSPFWTAKDALWLDEGLLKYV